MLSPKRINIAITGGPCTGKSTLAANLFANLKNKGFDYDLIEEESRKLKIEFGNFRSPFERFYMWRQQEREELRSTAINGFITDTALYVYYTGARYFASEPRDNHAVRELFRMCLELEEQDRYQLIILAKNPLEIPYKTDTSRSSDRDSALEKHRLIRTFLEHFCHKKLFFVEGDLNQRLGQALEKILTTHSS
jgi:nicotinamide riboside kinase